MISCKLTFNKKKKVLGIRIELDKSRYDDCMLLRRRFFDYTEVKETQENGRYVWYIKEVKDLNKHCIPMVITALADNFQMSKLYDEPWKHYQTIEFEKAHERVKRFWKRQLDFFKGLEHFIFDKFLENYSNRQDYSRSGAARLGAYSPRKATAKATELRELCAKILEELDVLRTDNSYEGRYEFEPISKLLRFNAEFDGRHASADDVSTNSTKYMQKLASTSLKSEYYEKTTGYIASFMRVNSTTASEATSAMGGLAGAVIILAGELFKDKFIPNNLGNTTQAFILAWGFHIKVISAILHAPKLTEYGLNYLLCVAKVIIDALMKKPSLAKSKYAPFIRQFMELPLADILDLETTESDSQAVYDSIIKHIEGIDATSKLDYGVTGWIETFAVHQKIDRRADKNQKLGKREDFLTGIKTELANIKGRLTSQHHLALALNADMDSAFNEAKKRGLEKEEKQSEQVARPFDERAERSSDISTKGSEKVKEKVDLDTVAVEETLPVMRANKDQRYSSLKEAKRRGAASNHGFFSPSEKIEQLLLSAIYRPMDMGKVKIIFYDPDKCQQFQKSLVSIGIEDLSEPGRPRKPEVTFSGSGTEEDKYAITLTAAEYNTIKNDDDAFDKLVSKMGQAPSSDAPTQVPL